MVEPSLGGEDGDLAVESSARSSRHFSCVQIRLRSVRSASGPEYESSDTHEILATPTRKQLMTSVLALQSALCLPSSLVRGGMEGSVDCSEIGDRCGKEAAGAGDFAWLAAGREDGGELLDLKHTYSSSAIGKGAVDKLTDSLGLCVAPDGAGAQGFLSEALNDSHWGEDEGLTMNRTLPPNADWATFSPVNSSSSYHTAGTSRNWMQTIGESSEDDPAITGRNDTAADVSPGWQAFTLGSEPTSTSLSLSETSALAGLSLDTHNRTGVNEPHRKEPRDSCSATTPDSVRHSCVSVFRHCFTEGHSGRGGGGGGEMGPRVVATECVNDWQCLRDNRYIVSMLYTSGYC